MHITLSGPYETLYTFAVDMWSFGCLCLNICIGKTAAWSLVLNSVTNSFMVASNIHCQPEELLVLRLVKVEMDSYSLYIMKESSMLLKRSVYYYVCIRVCRMCVSIFWLVIHTYFILGI